MSVSSLRAVSMMIGSRSSRARSVRHTDEAVEVGEGEVEQHEVDRAARRVERVVTVRDVRDVEALPFEGPQQRLRDRQVVFDEQDRGHRP